MCALLRTLNYLGSLSRTMGICVISSIIGKRLIRGCLTWCPRLYVHIARSVSFGEQRVRFSSPDPLTPTKHVRYQFLALFPDVCSLRWLPRDRKALPKIRRDLYSVIHFRFISDHRESNGFKNKKATTRYPHMMGTEKGGLGLTFLYTTKTNTT